MFNMSNKELEPKESSHDLSETERVLGSMPSFEDFRRRVEEKNGIVSGLDKIAEKYSYDEELRGTLEMIVPQIVDYFDDSEVVLKVLDNCPIFIFEPGKNLSEAANEYFGRNEKLSTIASGGASIIPRITEDGRIEVKKGIVLRSDREDSLQTLVHEICHQVASVNKEPQLESDGRIRIDIGLSSEYYGVDENGEMRMVESKRDFLEEMMNTYDTEKIMKGIKGDSFESNEYGILRKIAHACSADAIQKLERLRIHGDNTGDSVDYEKLDNISLALDNIMNIPHKIALSKEMAGGDREKAKIIRQEMDQRNYEEAVSGLNSF